MIQYKAPELFPNDDGKVKVFLAGTIEIGQSENWQEKICNALENIDIVILNPRRDDFYATQEQSPDNPYFRTQVEWELTALENADVILMYFDPNSKSPISLLELGLFHRKPMAVCCPDGFWRQGNIKIVCEWYDIPFSTDKELFFSNSVELCKSL